MPHEAHGVERLARAARCDQHATTHERARSEELLDPRGDLVGLRQAADAPLPFRELPLVGADELEASLP